MNLQPPVFISYRRTDAGGHAGRLFDRLKLWFDAGALFYDLDAIESGDIFPQRLEAAVTGAKVVLVVIGPDWLAEINRRATLAAVDFVRAEVELALRLHAANGTPKVIPVLMGGAKMPSLADLHETLRPSLQQLPDLDAHEFRGKNANWDQQFVQLRELITRVPGVPTPRYRAPAGTPKPFRVIDQLVSPHFRDPTAALIRVREMLLASGNAAIVVPAAMYGMGGVGKTQLALKYSHEYRDSYAGVWWFRAESESALQLDARDACLEAGTLLADGESPMTAFKRWLLMHEQPWLLVFDNAENANALRPHLPQGGPHHVLITSRDPAWGGLARPIQLTVWSDDEGSDFLAGRLPAADRADLRRLSHVLGGLPLALEQAAAFLEETGGTVDAYCAQIEAVDTAALVLDEGRASTGYERSVFATLSLAFPRLSVAARQLLSICAFFGAEPIPERYFREGVDKLPEALAGAASEGLAWERTAAELRRFSIVNRLDIASLDHTPSEPDGRPEKALALHRLTLEVARHVLSVPAKDGPRAQQLLLAQCPDDSQAPREWIRFAALLPHFSSLERLRSQGWLDRRAHSRMLDRAASYLRDAKALYPESRRMFELAVELDKADLGEEHNDTLVSMNNLAETLREQGDLSGARRLHEKVLEIRYRLSGEEHRETLVSMGNLAYTLHAEGNLRGARTLLERALAIQRRVLGQENRDTLTSMTNLANVLQAQGDLSGARTLEEQVVPIRRRVFGDEDPDTLASMNNLAHTLALQGDLGGARALHEQVLAISRRMWGEEHPNTLTSMSNLAHTIYKQGDRSGACTLEERVLLTRCRKLGEEDLSTLTSKNNVAYILWQLGSYDDAATLMAAAAEGRLLKLGAEHPHTKASFEALTAICAARNDAAAASAERKDAE